MKTQRIKNRHPGRSFQRPTFAVLFCFMGFTHAFCADDSTSANDKRDVVLEEMRGLMQRTVVQVQAAEGQEPVLAELMDQALIRYVEVDGLIGDSTFWVWTDHGRPVAAQKLEVNHQTGGNWTYCFASLSPETIRVEWPNVSGTFESEAGAKYDPIPDAPEPRSLSTLRAQQLRGLARRFTATADQGPERKFLQDLRLLPRPIFEYAAPRMGIVQGAVFGFASGTNPDALVVIELRQSADGKPTWFYAPIRMTSNGVEIRLNDEPVFSSESEWPRQQFPTWRYAFVPRAGN